MISASTTTQARRLILKSCSRIQSTSASASVSVSTAREPHQRYFATMASFVTDSMKNAVKSSMLQEAARPDSKLWSNESDYQHKPSRVSKHSDSISPNANQEDIDVDSPISRARFLMLHDPLDEWFLDSKPSGLAAPPLTPETDPFILSKADMKTLSQSIRTDLIGSDHPVLSKAASYFFEEGQDSGKKVRPMMVLLLSRAMQLHSEETARARPDLFRAQRRLAEISEMIHTASLFHDDVIDGADTRRGSPSVHKVFGNKMAILAGDYFIARASIFLARLRDVEVVETMSTIIEHLVRGEVMQMKGSDASDSDNERMVQYLRKNFYKTASLMANSCKSAALLGGYNDDIVAAAYTYGKHLGIAFQLVDDVLDYDGSASAMGKPALSDLNAGLATAPVLFAAEMYPTQLSPMIDRKFKIEGDVELAVEYVRKSDGIERTKDLAQVHVEIAIEAISQLDRSDYRDSLIHLAHKVVDRKR